MFFAALFCIYILLIETQNMAKQYTENLTEELQNSNQNSTLSLVSLIGL